MIQSAPFGRTGHLSTRVLFGAAALSRATQAQADEAIETLLQYGVNHIDTSASYGDSELLLGHSLAKYRDQFFLATKTDDRTYDAAKESLQRSLERLKTDHLDLFQFHCVIEDTELETLLGPKGALEAVIDARRQGLVRFIGITSHSLRAPVIHQKSLARFDFDSILMPWNYQLASNPEYAANFKTVLKTAKDKNVAVQIIKTAARRWWFDKNQRWSTTWYEPYGDQKSMDLAIHWALATPGVFINSPGDVKLLPMVLDAAGNYEKAPTDGQMQELMRTQDGKPLWE